MSVFELINQFARQEGSIYGNLGASDALELRKALSIGYVASPTGGTAGDASPLRPQSLDTTMRNLQFTMKHLVMSRMIPKVGGSGPIEEWPQLLSYGAQLPGFVADGSLPEEVDSTFKRVYGQTKLIGVTGRVTLMTQISKTVAGPALSTETSAKTALLLAMIENALFWGDSAINPLEWDGIEAQLIANAPDNVIDGRGLRTGVDLLIDMANRVGGPPNWGIPTHCFMGPRVKRDVIKDLLPGGRYAMDGGSGMLRIGADVDSVLTNYGSVKMEVVPFLTDGIDQNGGLCPTAAVGDSDRRPATPTLTTAASSPVNADSEFAAADAVAFNYSVVAVNGAGKSAPLAVTGTTPAAGDDIRFGITPGAGPRPTHFEVYRTVAGASSGDKRYIFRVAADAGNEVTVIDLNSFLPGTHKIFMAQFDPTVIQYYQLLPLARIPLAVTDLSTKFALLSMAQPAIKAPTKFMMVKNLSLNPAALGDP